MVLQELGPNYLRPGHGACAGCGLVVGMKLVMQAMGPRTIVIIVPSCEGAISGVYPNSPHAVPAFHSAFEIAAPTAAGIANALKVQGKDDIQVVAFAGDGGTFDIGLAALSGVTMNNDDIIYVCLDNEAYMNTGIQVSSSTPSFAWTGTTPKGNPRRKKNIMEIMAAHYNPYSATATIGFPHDLQQKIVKAKGIRGTKFIHLLSPCPTGWRMPSDISPEVSILAVETNVFPLYEVENGKRYTINHEPRCLPVQEYLLKQGRFRHLKEEQIRQIQMEVDEEWEGLNQRTIRSTSGCK
ncbi:MAG: thiamine pyrophosphate-dependent enzyme [Thermodesulfobacteriota bacterium]|jgi:pyruvate ferredoxin oxidoreductase beta subunit/2-oxoisovalerate ferredoxin oxidoreductase beta subunit